ncbi:nucleoside hydrolase [Mycoplasmatota bacterium]|nr:nucleoside hydrolase [Mycoplasmatota bacterium]
MRKIIIDTDTGSDDAVAILMAMFSEEIEVCAITTVSGNCHLEQATKNCLQTLEIANTYYPPVYKGSHKPLFRDLFTAKGVHGEDGMGDQSLIHPTIKHHDGHAVDKILELIKKYPYEIEIITLGPLTNIAKAILLDKDTMSQVKQIYSMGTSGLGPGNCTPVSEFNVYVDAESYKVLLESGIPMTIIGFDICLGDSALQRKEIDLLMESENKTAHFAIQCNQRLYQYNLENTGQEFIDLPDPIAMGVLLWPEIVEKELKTHAKVMTNQDETYGQVIFYGDKRLVLANQYQSLDKNVSLVTKINHALFKTKLINILKNSQKNST